MRRFWFVVSLILVFVFTASASYIYFALADSPKEVDEPYMALGTPVTQLAAEVKTVLPEVQLTIREPIRLVAIRRRKLLKLRKVICWGLLLMSWRWLAGLWLRLVNSVCCWSESRRGFVRRRRSKVALSDGTRFGGL